MRIVSGTVLAAMIGLALGCGGKSDPTPAGDVKLEPAPAPGGTPVDPGNKGSIPPTSVPAVWEMDPAKHTIPASPPAGRLAGATIAPVVRFEGDTLSFRVLKDGVPERHLSIKLPPAKAKTAADGVKLIVAQETTAGPDVPEIMASFPPPKPGVPGDIAYVNGYALTLELGKREKDKLPGKIYLSLPGEGKDFLAGTFSAEWIRPVSELPGPDDTPFVQGKVTVAGTVPDTLQVRVGYAGEPKPNEFASDSVTMPLVGQGLSVRADYEKPRVTVFVAAEAAGKPARYEHSRLAPGRYICFAAVEKGPAVWKWIVVPADGKVALDFDIDPTKFGSLEVTAPEGVNGKVQLTPADEPASAISNGLITSAAFALGLEVEVKNRVARFEKLAPGKYEVRLGDSGEYAGFVEVKLNETAKLELKKK